jgi:hypothetical protein
MDVYFEAGDSNRSQNWLTVDLAGTTSLPYGILRGPYIVSDRAVNFGGGDIITFLYNATATLDYYDIIVYLQDIYVPSKQIVILNRRGTGTTGWTRVNYRVNVGDAGTYRLVFVNGSYDATGRMGLGAKLQITCIDTIPLADQPITTPTTTIFTCYFGQTETKLITGRSVGGPVYGSNPYTEDSDFGKAAVHAGLLQVGETNWIEFFKFGIQGNFTGSMANGIISLPYLPQACAIRISLGTAPVTTTTTISGGVFPGITTTTVTPDGDLTVVLSIAPDSNYQCVPIIGSPGSGQARVKFRATFSRPLDLYKMPTETSQQSYSWTFFNFGLERENKPPVNVSKHQVFDFEAYYYYVNPTYNLTIPFGAVQSRTTNGLLKLNQVSNVLSIPNCGVPTTTTTAAVPIMTCQAVPPEITADTVSTTQIYWTSVNASKVTAILDGQDVGAIALNGAYNYGPFNINQVGTKTVKFTATGAGGSTTCTLNIVVKAPPTTTAAPPRTTTTTTTRRITTTTTTAASYPTSGKLIVSTLYGLSNPKFNGGTLTVNVNVALYNTSWSGTATATCTVTVAGKTQTKTVSSSRGSWFASFDFSVGTGTLTFTATGTATVGPLSGSETRTNTYLPFKT